MLCIRFNLGPAGGEPSIFSFVFRTLCDFDPVFRLWLRHSTPVCFVMSSFSAPSLTHFTVCTQLGFVMGPHYQAKCPGKAFDPDCKPQMLRSRAPGLKRDRLRRTHHSVSFSECRIHNLDSVSVMNSHTFEPTIICSNSSNERNSFHKPNYLYLLPRWYLCFKVKNIDAFSQSSPEIAEGLWDHLMFSY